MKIIKLFTIALFAFISMFFSVGVFAEEINNKIPEEEKSIVNIDLNTSRKTNTFSSASILNPKINSQENGLFDISFSLSKVLTS